MAAIEVIESGWYLRGERVAKFEDDICQYLGCRYAVSTGNGLDALRLILKAYIQLGDISVGDEVILPANTFIATLIAVKDSGLTPVIADVSADTYNLNTDNLHLYITPRTRAIMPVHLYGRSCWDEKLKSIAKEHNLKIIEDNAQALGALSPISGINGGYKCGNLGDAAGTSLYPAKNLGALGDAGVVTTNNKELADIIRAMTCYGETERYTHKYAGCNSRMDELQAAFLSIKLRYLDRENAYRNNIAQLYNKHITNPNIIKPQLPVGGNCVWHQYVIRCKNRSEVQRQLSENGITTLIHYPTPVHKHEAFGELNHLSMPVAEYLSGEILSLPINSTMSTDVVIAITDFINKL